MARTPRPEKYCTALLVVVAVLLAVPVSATTPMTAAPAGALASATSTTAAAGVASSGAVASVDAGLLFAGLDGAFSFRTANPDDELIQGELVGIIVDGEEFGTELVYRLGEAY